MNFKKDNKKSFSQISAEKNRRFSQRSFNFISNNPIFNIVSILRESALNLRKSARKKHITKLSKELYSSPSVWFDIAPKRITKKRSYIREHKECTKITKKFLILNS